MGQLGTGPGAQRVRGATTEKKEITTKRYKMITKICKTITRKHKTTARRCKMSTKECKTTTKRNYYKETHNDCKVRHYKIGLMNINQMLNMYIE